MVSTIGLNMAELEVNLLMSRTSQHRESKALLVGHGVGVTVGGDGETQPHVEALFPRAISKGLTQVKTQGVRHDVMM